MNAPEQITVRLRFTWWAKAYLSSVMLFAHLTGMQPDEEKVLTTVLKGLRTEVLKR